jgi:hypothetical protein
MSAGISFHSYPFRALIYLNHIVSVNSRGNERIIFYVFFSVQEQTPCLDVISVSVCLWPGINA